MKLMKLTKLEKVKQLLYSYVLHFNYHKDEWFLIPRESYVDYWNGKLENIISDKTMSGLLNKINYESNSNI